MRSIAFTKVGCTCPAPLFRKKYLRSHCSNGSKVLRCFPHCCPTHVEGTYCGSSIAVAVAASPALLARCVVFFRLEASYDETFACGQAVAKATVTSDERHPSRLRGTWIAARRVHVQGEVTSFEYDGAEGWHYGWKGGSSIHQRLSWHRIKAYVFLTNPAESPTSWVVVATASSPPFFVMSYRRSCKACQASDSSISRDGCECAGVFRLSDSLLQGVLAQGDSHFEIMAHVPAVKPTGVQPPIPGYLDHERVVAMFVKALSSARHSPSPSSIPPFVKALVAELASTTRSHEPEDAGKTAGLAPPAVINLCVEIVLAVVKDRATFQQFLQQHAGDILHQHHLWLGYEQWVYHLNTKIHSILLTKSVPFATFVDALGALGDAKPPETPPPSSTSFSPVFLFYVAQLREVYMAIDTRPPDLPSTSALSGAWALNVDSIQASFEPSFSPSVLSVLRWFTVGYRVRQIVAGHLLLIQSDLALFPTKWSEFVLDNEPRIFRVFPNGETSMATADGLFHGDYVGSVDETSGAVRLELVSWPTAPDSPCIVVRVQMTSRDANTLDCVVDVITANVSPNQVGNNSVDGLSPHERIHQLRQNTAETKVVRVSGMYSRNT